ncbi:MAG: hypothetical protein R3A11_04650 [Bdellovibrionota bacterium]
MNQAKPPSSPKPRTRANPNAFAGKALAIFDRCAYTADMNKPCYLQIFSITDHVEPLNNRYQGPYQGINAGVQSSEIEEQNLRIFSGTLRNAQDSIDPSEFEQAKVILAYRHSDTGVLSGTSESLIPIKALPWLDMPGLEILDLKKSGNLTIKMWDQETTLQVGKLLCIRFGKTIVYTKNHGQVSEIEWSSHNLKNGPSSLHKQDISQEITIAPPSGSALQVKMGQDTNS